MSSKPNFPTGLTPDDAQRVRRTFREVERLDDVFAMSLYSRLFEQTPAIRYLFNTDTAVQSRKFMAAMKRLVDHIDRWQEMMPELRSLGRRHGYFGVRANHYPLLKRVLLGALKETTPNSFDNEDALAWDKFYSAIAAVMIEASAPIESTEVDTTIFFKDRRVNE